MLALSLATLLPCGVNFIASATTGCPSDLNNDRVVNVVDLLGIINGWGPCTGGQIACPADIAPLGGNSVINIDDLLTVITGFGACPCLPGTNCLSATPIWCEDFQTGNYSRWTDGYGAGSSCESIAFTSSRFVSPTKSHRSTVTCSAASSHRGYGGLRFQGNNALQSFATPSTAGISAPNGVVVTFWSWIDAPYTFDSNRWLSLMTVTNDCSNNWADPVCLNIDDSSMRLKPVRVTNVTYAPGAPSFPRGQWNRVTTYMNFQTGSMHVWQNGVKVVSATFSRPTTTLCQWHWGLYASGANNNITMHEDDISIVKLNQPMTNFTLEPWFGVNPLCVAGP